jgi:xanthine/CO dehydrogenase XdhC/CoxF family maturation factor
MSRTFLDFIVSQSQTGKPIAVITRIEHDGASTRFAAVSDEIFTTEDEQLPSHVITAARSLAESRKLSEVIELPSDRGTTIYILDIIRQKPALVIFGAGHVGQAVALMGALVGYKVTVVDDREEFLSRSRFPDNRIEVIGSDFQTAARQLSLNRNTAVVIVTRGHQYDELCLSEVAGTNAGYIGMIGSKRRVISVMARLRERGIPASHLDAVHAPIGLRIGAKSPQEIAVAIVAEVIAAFNDANRSQ